MSPRHHPCTGPVPRALLLWALAAFGLCGAATAQAQPNAAGRVPVVAGAETGPRWQELSPAQRSALKPLERDWSTIDAAGKQKWLEIVARYPSLPPAEQQRISGRMAEWVKMSPSQRGQARLNFQSARELTPEERQARWKAYQALTPEQRSRLAARASPGTAPAARGADNPRRPQPSARDAVQSKSNIVPNPSYAGSPKPIGPSVVQGAPGATTSLISKRPAPPTHQQPGLPKIAATPGFVDKQTLLPQRGAQGAAAATPPSSSANRR